MTQPAPTTSASNREELAAGVREVAEQITADYYYAAKRYSAARRDGDVPTHSYWNGVKTQAASVVDALSDLIGDARPDWEAIDIITDGDPIPPA